MGDSDQVAAKLRRIPPVDQLQHHEVLAPLVERLGSVAVVRAIRSVLDAIRDDVRVGGDVPSTDQIALRAASRAAMEARPQMRRVINATGIILHTGLGRALLPRAAVDALSDAAAGYCNLAADLEKGERAERCRYVEQLLCEITGAEAAHVVNNNAAATVIALNTLAASKEAIVSRGQLVEIGGEFRIPDIMLRSGVKLVEVGTTNRTHMRDYENAITSETALLLRVHQSNYRIVGFTSDVPIEPMVELGHKRGLAVMDDLGSGALVDFARFGLDPEPTAQASIKAGADVVTFSADKLIGGPQGGILLGTQQAIARIRKNQWARILRIGKLELIALEATLKLFLDPDRLIEQNPTIRMLLMDTATLSELASRLAEQIRAAAPAFEVAVIDATSELGSGSMPTRQLPTKAVAVTLPATSPDELARRLRLADPPIFTRIVDDRVLLDVRTIQDDEYALVADAFRGLNR